MFNILNFYDKSSRKSNNHHFDWLVKNANKKYDEGKKY